jgi:flagellar biosynthesis protein
MNQELKRQAVALRYEPKKEAAPRLVAKGDGYLAEKILELARLYDIPIRQDKKLLQILSRLDLEEEIPPEVYKAVTEILAFIYRLSNRPMEISGSRQNILPGQATSRH